MGVICNVEISLPDDTCHSTENWNFHLGVDIVFGFSLAHIDTHGVTEMGSVTLD